MARIARNRRALERRRPGVLDILFMVSGASAVALSDFQVITSSSVNFACILAYNAPILGCSSKDFTQGNTCSSSCESGLKVLEMTLETVCDGVNAPDNSILGQALRGNLVDTVCPSGDSSTTSSVSSKTSTVAIILTSTEKSIPTLTRIPPSTTSSSDDEDTTSTISTPTELSTIIIQTSSSVADPAPAQTTSNAERTTTDTTGARQTAPSSADKPQATRGGGSPFDATTNSSPKLLITITQQCVLAAVLSLLLLR